MTLPDTIKGEPDFTRENFREAIKTIENLEQKVLELDKQVRFLMEITDDRTGE